MKKVNFLLSLTLLSLLAVSCKQTPSNVIEIGAILPLTGYGAANGQMCKNGLELAVNEINNSQKDFVFSLTYEDNKSSTKDGLMAYRKLYNAGFDYYVGFGGQYLLGFIPETNNKDIILFVNGTPNLNILSQTNRCFRVYPNIDMFTDKIIEFYNDNEIKNAGVVFLQNEAYTKYGESFREKFRKQGGVVSIYEGFEPNCRDFKNIINKVAKSGAQCIFVSGAGESTAMFTHQLFANPRTSHISVIGDMSLSTSSNIEIIGECKSPVYYIDNYMDSCFVESYKVKYQSNPNAYAVYAYAIPYVLLQACKEKKDISDVKAIYDYIKGTSFSTAAGQISFDSVTCEPNLEMTISIIND